MNIYKNELSSSKSPYLQQHANNPVNWQTWSPELLEKAVELDRLLIVSIGYSACHWCHVMEAEVFEKNEAAEVMNAHFIPIKVDREERPDIDEIYMRALQLMKGQGGWPLNVVCLPDGKPVWGATYVPLNKWLEVLQQLAEMYREDKDQVRNYGEQLTQGIQQSMLVKLNRSPLQIEPKELDELVQEWSKSFDSLEGGPKRAPKFPMPVNLNFLLEYGLAQNNSEALTQVELSLDKMAMGGIYDQIGGGFARYSVDALWKVPHFEKMLYDNAQLISLYSKAYRHFKKPLYEETLQQSWQFLEREMLDPSGAWYSALDADSEGEEGKYYIWKKEELQSLIPNTEWPIFAACYSINEDGYWENENYILLRRAKDEDIAQRFNFALSDLKSKVKTWQKLLLEKRKERIKPGLDDKALCSWNALMITAACDAYRAFPDDKFLNKAKSTAAWILSSQKKEDGMLMHAWQNGESHIDGLLEDYAFCIEAFINLWQLSADENYLHQAQLWLGYVLKHFEDRESGLFLTRAKNSEALISKGMETQDNVMASANSVMAHNLYKLGLIYGKSAWLEQAKQNLAHLKKQVIDYGESFANWARLALYEANNYYEIAIIGPEAEEFLKELDLKFSPLEFYFHSPVGSELAVFAGRLQEGKTLIYPCQQGSCQLPYNSVQDFQRDFRG